MTDGIVSPRLGAALLAFFLAVPALAQTAPAPPPAQAPAAPAPPAAAAARPTLIPTPGDPSNADEVVLASKPVAVMSGTSTWDDGFNNLKGSFKRIEEELARAGIAPAGRPLALFVETDDMGFRYDAMIPIPAQPEGRGTLPPEIRFGKTPEGKAWRFVHKDPYDEIDFDLRDDHRLSRRQGHHRKGRLP